MSFLTLTTSFPTTCPAADVAKASATCSAGVAAGVTPAREGLKGWHRRAGGRSRREESGPAARKCARRRQSPGQARRETKAGEKGEVTDEGKEEAPRSAPRKK